MNTIKISKQNNLREETHNVEVYSQKEIIINNIKYKVDEHVSLMIYPTIKCNASCSFCINKFDDGLKSCKDLEDNDEYLIKLEVALELLKDLHPTIQICGGEPTLSNKLVPILKLINSYNLNLRSFPTNGSGMLRKYNKRTIIQHMVDNNFINNINLSRVNFDEEKNNKIMKISLTNKEIETIGAFCEINAMTFRMSCVLMKGQIENLEYVLKYHNLYANLGIESSIFRELVKIDQTYKERYLVHISTIINEIKEDERFKFVRTLEGAYYRVDVFLYKDYIVKCYQEKFKEDQDYIRDFIFYPDGKLYIARWGRDNERIL